MVEVEVGMAGDGGDGGRGGNGVKVELAEKHVERVVLRGEGRELLEQRRRLRMPR